MFYQSRALRRCSALLSIGLGFVVGWSRCSTALTIAHFYPPIQKPGDTCCFRQQRNHHVATTRLQSSFSSEPSCSPDTAKPGVTASYPKGSTLTLIDPETGCEVVLLGCFHGARSSADDVNACLSASPENNDDSATPTIVALELCATRFAGLRRDLLKEREAIAASQQERLHQLSSTTKKPFSRSKHRKKKRDKPWLSGFVNMVRKTIEKQGWATGLAAAILGSISGLQTSMSGLEPGLEFRTALLHAMEQHGANHSTSSSTEMEVPCNVVLADQNVDETLEKIGELPLLSLTMWFDLLTMQRSWHETFGREANALGTAVGLGHGHVTVAGFATRSRFAIRDMLRLVVPPLVFLQASLLVVNGAFDWLQAQPEWIDAAATAALATSQDASSSLLSSSALDPAHEGLWWWWSHLVAMALGYCSVALPAVRVVLRERDIVLAENVRYACQRATRNGTQPGRVVAVLGLLHVNGVAQRLLLSAGQEEPQASAKE